MCVCVHRSTVTELDVRTVELFHRTLALQTTKKRIKADSIKSTNFRMAIKSIKSCLDELFELWKKKFLASKRLTDQFGGVCECHLVAPVNEQIFESNRKNQSDHTKKNVPSAQMIAGLSDLWTKSNSALSIDKRYLDKVRNLKTNVFIFNNNNQKLFYSRFELRISKHAILRIFTEIFSHFFRI